MSEHRVQASYNESKTIILIQCINNNCNYESQMLFSARNVYS